MNAKSAALAAQLFVIIFAVGIPESFSQGIPLRITSSAPRKLLSTNRTPGGASRRDCGYASHGEFLGAFSVYGIVTSGLRSLHESSF